jgi:hypothetical protein
LPSIGSRATARCCWWLLSEFDLERSCSIASDSPIGKAKVVTEKHVLEGNHLYQIAHRWSVTRIRPVGLLNSFRAPYRPHHRRWRTLCIVAWLHFWADSGTSKSTEGLAQLCSVAARLTTEGDWAAACGESRVVTEDSAELRRCGLPPPCGAVRSRSSRWLRLSLADHRVRPLPMPRRPHPRVADVLAIVAGRSMLGGISVWERQPRLGTIFDSDAEYLSNHAPPDDQTANSRVENR